MDGGMLGRPRPRRAGRRRRSHRVVRPPCDVADRLPGIFEDHDLVGQEGDALKERAR